MKQLELKYGCNPNQKPASISVNDGRDLPIEVLNGKPGYINFMDCRRRRPLSTSLPPARRWGCPSVRPTGPSTL